MYDKEYKKYLKKIRINKFLVHFFQMVIIVLFIFLWECLSNKGIINSFVYSSPSRAIKTVYKLYLDNNLFGHIWITVYETIISFVLATLMGTIIAIILW